MKNWSKRKMLAIAALAVAGAAAVIGLTAAMLRATTETAENAFEAAAVNIAVWEDGKIYEDADNSNSGYAAMVSEKPVSKTVAVKNLDLEDYPTVDTYVRVRLVPAFRYDSGKRAGQVAAMDMRDAVSYTFGDSKDWKVQKSDSGEDYYYYTKVLVPGAVTPDLITAVKFTGKRPEGAHFELQVLSDGVAATQKGVLGQNGPWGEIDFSKMDALK